MAFKCRADADHIVEPILKYVVTLFNVFGLVSITNLTYLIFSILNVLFQLISIGYFVGGAWLLYQRDDSESTKYNLEDIYNLSTDLGGFLIALGVVGIIFAIIAIAATIRENVFVLRMVFNFS